MSTADQVVAAARSKIGDPYEWGGDGPDDFDCSGLCQWAYAQVGIAIPRTSEEQCAGGQFAPRDQLQPGDLVIYYADASHVALYSGNGNVIEASTYGVPIEEVPIDYAGPYNQARRYLPAQGISMPLFGVDVSNNNWSSIGQCQAAMAEIQREGFAWVEAKVSEGGYYSDPYWSATLNACNAIGLPCIGYHYVTTNDAASQARLFVANGGGNVAMLDFEANSGDINNFWAVVNAFNAAGVRITLSYIPRWYWQEIGSPDISGAPGLIASSYVGGSGYASALYPGDGWLGWNSYGGATPAILQFTDAALVAGTSMDANAFRGTPEQLTALLTGGPVTQPTDPTLAVAEDNQIQLRGPGLNGWPQLAGHTVVDALAAIGHKLGLDGFNPPS